MESHPMRIGAIKGNEHLHFTVWAPFKKRMDLHIVSPEDRILPMEKKDSGYWTLKLEDSLPVTEYYFRIEEQKERPDPVSFYQPKGVHGPSHIVDHRSFPWTDGKWKGIRLNKMIFYEIHVGTFTQEGTFAGVLKRLEYLKNLGINALEMMPVAQFPGDRNWGYDGVYPFAVQNSYGGPEGLKKLVDACHAFGMAIGLDVVYNHLGPEGNYLSDFGPYFTDRYRTDWGGALNFDGEFSNEVRHYFIENALYWLDCYHMDFLRLDAIHGIFDFGARHLLKEMAERIAKYSRTKNRIHPLIAESDLNNSIVVSDPRVNGYGLQGQWMDDYHHCLHTLLTCENSGYYQDFGKLNQLGKSLDENFVYSGQYSPYRKRNHGNSVAEFSGNKFVVFSQNHDQTGNRPQGERLSALCDFERLKLAAGMTILSPFIPLLFMGEEYGEEAPFLYFISHSDLSLIEAVRKGRIEGMETFGWKKQVPDPYDLSTFEKSRLNWEKTEIGHHAILLNFYRELIRLRQNIPVLSQLGKRSLKSGVIERENILTLHRFQKKSETFLIAHFSKEEARLQMEFSEGVWDKTLDSFEECWQGKGSLLQWEGRKAHLGMQGFGFLFFERRFS